MMKQTIHHGMPLTFASSFGTAEVERMNGLWRVTFEGRADWYSHLDQACSVAINLAKHGVPPAGIQGLCDRANKKEAL